MHIGINLAVPDANQPEAPFLNLMRLRSGWTGGPVDAQGVPTGATTAECVVQIPVVRGLGVDHDLIVSDNVASVKIVGASDATGTATRKPVNGLVRFTSSLTKPGATLQLKATPKGTGPFTVALVPTKHRARYDAGETFNPDFLASLAPFSRIRAMDWSRANSFELTHRRALLSDDSWNPTGVPVEAQAQLATALGQDLWTNIPHLLLARTDIVQDIIGSARAALDPKLRLIVEPGNEIWNADFAVHAFAANAAGDANVWCGQQCAALSKLLRPGDQVALCAQSGGTSGIKKVVAAYQAAGGDLKRARIACAPYLSSGSRPTLTAKGGAKDVAGALAMFQGQLASWAGTLKGWGDYAKSIGVPFDAYETNVLVATIPPNQDFQQSVQFDDHTAALFMSHLDACEAAGMDTANVFNDCSAPGNAGQWAMWPWPGAEPYPIGKAVLARAAGNKAPAADPFMAELAAIRARIDDLGARYAASLKAA